MPGPRYRSGVFRNYPESHENTSMWSMRETYHSNNSQSFDWYSNEPCWRDQTWEDHTWESSHQMWPQQPLRRGGPDHRGRGHVPSYDQFQRFACPPLPQFQERSLHHLNQTPVEEMFDSNRQSTSQQLDNFEKGPKNTSNFHKPRSSSSQLPKESTSKFKNTSKNPPSTNKSSSLIPLTNKVKATLKLLQENKKDQNIQNDTISQTPCSGNVSSSSLGNSVVTESHSKTTNQTPSDITKNLSKVAVSPSRGSDPQKLLEGLGFIQTTGAKTTEQVNISYGNFLPLLINFP